MTRRDGRYRRIVCRRARIRASRKDHFVEFEIGEVRLKPDTTLVASGWIYPTDSSINVAIGQGGHVTPSGLALDARVT